MSTDLVNLHRLWCETDQRLDSLSKCVREGVGINEASNFARWLRFSCVLEILEPHAQDMPLPIRPLELRQKMERLIEECGEWNAVHRKSFTPRDAYISPSKLESIDDRLAQIEAMLSRSAEAEPLRIVGNSNAS